MLNYKSRFLAAVFCSFALTTGCSTVARLHTEDDKQRNFAPTEAAHVKIYYPNSFRQNYEVLGPVVAAADSENSVNVVEKLQEEAAQLGANGIIEMQLEIEYGFWSTGIKASGLAIKK